VPRRIPSTASVPTSYYSSNNMKLVHWPLMGGLLHLIQRGGDWAGRCTIAKMMKDNYNSATSLLSELQWLSNNKRINFKIATVAYQSLAFAQPTYLSSVLTPHQPQWSLRSVNQNLSSAPHCNSSFRQRSFSYCASKIWNDIPLLVRQSQSPSFNCFKGTLRRRLTYIFFSFNKKFNI